MDVQAREKQGRTEAAAVPTSRRPVYAALDLGTNNCRLMIARRTSSGFRVIDAFSRIVCLGEGIARTGRLSDAAVNRTLTALKVCAVKLARRVGRHLPGRGDRGLP